MNKNIQTGIVMMVTFVGSYFLKVSNTKSLTLSAIIGFTFYVLFEIVSWRNNLDKRLEKIEQDVKNIQDTKNANYKIMSNQITKTNSNSNSDQSIEVMK